MKDGVYMNTFKGKANLLTIINGSMVDGEVVTIEDYNVRLIIEGDSFIMAFSELEYLGELWNIYTEY